jgi:hypothetical protein
VWTSLDNAGLIKWRRNTDETHRFRRIEGGIIPPKRRPGIVVVVGEILKEYTPHPNKREPTPEYWILESGLAENLETLIQMAICLKDDWLVDIYWLPHDEEDLSQQLMDAEGLTFYDEYRKTLLRQKMWPTYRSNETTASIRCTELRQDYLIRMMAAIKDNRQLKIVAENNQTLLGRSGVEPTWAMALPLGEMVKNPLKPWHIEEIELMEDNYGQEARYQVHPFAEENRNG